MNASRIWIETQEWLEPFKLELIEGCNEAANSGGCPVPASALEDGARCQLTCAPAKLLDCMPPDTFQSRAKETGIVRLHGNGQLRPFEQVILTAAIEKLVLKLFLVTHHDYGQSDATFQSQTGTDVSNESSLEEWYQAPLWKDITALDLLKYSVRATQSHLPESSGEKALVDPCDDVLTFLCALMESKQPALDSISQSGDILMKDGEKTDNVLSDLTAVTRLLLVNVKAAANPHDLCQPRDLSLKIESGDISKISVSTATDGLSRLLDDSPSTYWESSGSVGNHIIEIALTENVVLSAIGIRVNRQDGSYCPRKLEISVLKSGESKWKVLSEKTIEPRGNQICMLAEDLDASEEYQSVKIRILKNFDNGNDSRVHGLKVVGQPRGVNRMVKISESVALSVLASSQKALGRINKTLSQHCSDNSLDDVFKVQIFLLHLEASTKALVSAASVLSLLSSDRKGQFLIGLLNDYTQRIGNSSGVDISASGADIALNAAFDSVNSPSKGLELLDIKASEASSDVNMQLVDCLLQFGCHEVELILSGDCSKISTTVSDEWLRFGKTPCVHTIAQIQSGIFMSSLQKKEESSASRAVDSYVTLFCVYARKLLHIFQDFLVSEKGSMVHGVEKRWPKQLEVALSRCFLASSLGPLMVGLSSLDWIRIHERTSESLTELVGGLLQLSEADAGCRAVLNGILDSSTVKMKCPAGHDLQRKTLISKSLCSCCEKEISIDIKAQSCAECSFHVCRGCTYLTGCYCSKRSPDSSCRPSVWIALAISAFFNCAAIKLFEVESKVQKDSPSNSWIARYRYLLSAGLQPDTEAGSALEEELDSSALLHKMRSSEGFFLNQEAMSTVNAMDSNQLAAIGKIFLALLHHCKLEKSVLRDTEPLPKIFIECYLKSTAIVIDQIRDCRITNKNVASAIDDLTSRANFLLKDVCVTIGSHQSDSGDAMELGSEGPVTPLSRENSDPPSALVRQRSSTNAAAVPLFPAPLIRSESQNSVMRRSTSVSAAERDAAAFSNQIHSDYWEVGDRRELAESVVRFVCDRSLIVEELRATSRRIRTLCERHCRSLHLINELTKVLTAACPKSTLRTNFIRLVLVNLQSCRSWMEAGVIRCSAMDEFKQLLQTFMKMHVLPALKSDKEDDKLCGIAALSAVWREEDLTMLVSSGIWEGVVSLCRVRKDSNTKEHVGGFMYKPRKILGESQVAIHSASANMDSARHVLDTESTALYWQSDVGSNPERWIMFEIKPPQYLEQVILYCADDLDRGSGYAPRDITLEVGGSPDSLERILTASIPINTNGPHPLLPAGKRVFNEPCSFVKFRIVECGGRNCRVRGMSFELKGVDESNASLPAVTVLSRAAATSLILTAFARAEGYKISIPSALQVSECKRAIVTSLISLLRQSSQFDASTHSFGMGLVSLCLPAAEIQHGDPTMTRLTKDLMHALLTLFSKEATEARILAQAVGLLQTLMKSCPPEMCDASALAARGALLSSSSQPNEKEMSDADSLSGLQFLEIATDFLHHHIDNPIKFLVARQSLTELMLDLASRPAWKVAVSRFARQQLEILSRKNLESNLSTPAMTRAQYALSLLGGYIPILQLGCNAQLETGEHVRVLHYEFGDARSGVVLLDGSISFVNSATLAMSPLSVSYLSLQDLTILLPLLKLLFGGDFRGVPDGKLKNTQLMDIYTRLLRCIVEHASQRPNETGKFLDENGLLPHLIEIALKATPKGSLIVSLNTLEEQMAAFESRVKFDSIYAVAQGPHEAVDESDMKLDTSVLTSPSVLESKAQRDSSKPLPKYFVGREHIWNSVKDKDGNSPISPKQARGLIETVHHDMSLLYGLRASLILLPALPTCKGLLTSNQWVGLADSIGDIGRQLLEKGIVCHHPILQIESAISAFTAQDGPDGSGLQLLKCIHTRLQSKELASARKPYIARSAIEAYPVGARNSEWSVSLEFVGGAQFSVVCDPLTKLHGTVVLQTHKSNASQASNSAPAALTTFKPDDVRADGEAAKVLAKGAVLLAKFTPASSIEMSKVGMRVVAEAEVGAVVVESEHKYKDNVSYRGSVTIEGAQELSIEFDKRCSTESGCDKLTFYTDEQYKADPFSASHEFSGSGESVWRTFSVKSDRIFYIFTSDSSRNDWGYRFTVRSTGDLPVSDEASAHLSVASRSIHAALQQGTLLRSLQTREWCQVLASVCDQVGGSHRRSFFSCLSRLVATAADFPAGELPTDSTFSNIVKQFIADYEAHLQRGDPVGTPDLLACALFLNAW